MLKKIYIDFFRMLINNADNLSAYVDSLYCGDDYSESDLNQIFGVLKSEGLIVCTFADNRVYSIHLTFEGKHYFDDEQTESGLQRLIKLIDSIQIIEKEFHTISGVGGLPSVVQIHDSQVFQDWINSIIYELGVLYKQTEDDFIKGTMDLASGHFNGFNDERVFKELKGKLNVIKNNQSSYMGYKEIEGEKIMNDSKQPLIFISHSSKNKEEVKLLTDLLMKLRLEPKKDIFCSSIPGFDIPITYENGIFEFLRDKFNNNTIHAVFIHSHDYYLSPVCLNEMGAAWVLKTIQTSFLLPGFDFKDMKGVINGSKIAIKLDNELLEVKDKLNQLRKQLEEEFSLEPIEDIIWEQARDVFIEKINKFEKS